MQRRFGRAVRIALLVSAASGLAACQTAENKPQVQASAPAQGGMDSDIRRILTAGGLDANAPGTLQTAKMPPEVQQAVAALQGGAPATPASPALASAVPGTPALGSAASAQAALTAPLNPQQPPMVAALQATGAKAGKRGRASRQLALAPAPASAVPVPQVAVPQVPVPQVAAAEPPAGLSQVQSYLPVAPPQMQTIVLTGPNAHPRYSAASVAVPSPRAAQVAQGSCGQCPSISYQLALDAV